MKENELLKLLQQLNTVQQKEIVDEIISMLKKPVNEIQAINTCNKMISENSEGRPDCPNCHAEAKLGFIVKRGMKSGAQRYLCKKCNKYFMPSTNTAFANTRKDADVWRKFVELTITGASLKKCSAECNIAYQTAFTWRHKILNAFYMDQKRTNMNGVVEMDEMLVPISYKGNHVQGHFNEKRTCDSGKHNDMPRASFKRGTDNKSKSSKDKICVFCMVEDGNKAFFAETTGTGFMKNATLNATVGQHVNKDTAIVLVDEYKVTKAYLLKNGYTFKSLLSNTSDNRNAHKPQIDGEYHLQHINVMHTHIRHFLSQYYGVSSKYLRNYVSLYVWIKHMKEKKKNLANISIMRASFADCYVTRNTLEDYPSIPLCA